ncbi:MAG: hypothetical protein WBE55_14600 [Candidatus Sulfotelmatobacter sp.]
MKLRQLALRLVILPSRGLDQRHLAFDLLQFLLRLIAGFHVWMNTVLLNMVLPDTVN